MSKHFEMLNHVNVDYKAAIVQQIEERNQQYDRFSELINSYIKLYENNATLRKEALHCKEHAEKLKQENQELANKAHAGASVTEKSEQYAALEQKLFKIQEELTEVHRSKGARAQQIINLNLALQEKEREAANLNIIFATKEEEINKLTKQLSALNQKIDDLQQANQTVNDEYQALHITYLSVEEKLKKSQMENQDLIDRWTRRKHMEAEALNTENERTGKAAITEMQNDSAINMQGANRLRKDSSPSSQTASVNQTVFPESPPSSFSLKQKFADFFSGKSRTNEEDSHSNYASTYPSMQCSAIVRLPQEVLCKWKAHESEVTATKFSFSGGTLATGGSDRLIHLWTFGGDKSRLQATLRGCNGGVTSIDFDPQEQSLAAGSNDFSSKIFSMISHRLKLCLTGHKSKVLSSRFLGSPYRLASGSNDRTVKVWDIKTGGCIRTFMAGSSCNEIVPIDTGDCLASGHFDRKIRIWDARAGSQVQNEIVVGGRVTSLDMPVDKTSMVCCTKNHTLELIDIRKASVHKIFSDDTFKVAMDQTRCAFSTDGQYVCGLSSDGSVLTWNVNSDSLVSVVQRHSDPVISCSWSGGRLVTGDKNKHCIVWNEL